MICATLYMISQLLSKQPALSASSFAQPAKIEPDDIKVEKQISLPAAFLDEESEDEHYEDVPLEEVCVSKIVVLFMG